MNGLELWQALAHNAITQPYFHGIYAPDTLDNIHYKPTLIICNTDPSYKPGTHWIAFYFQHPGKTVELFDSLGHHLKDYALNFTDFVALHSNQCKTLINRVQPLQSALCGHYCLYYAYYRCLGYSMESIVNTMPSSLELKNIVFKLFNIIPCCNTDYQCCIEC
jgi:hypothetical protein